MTIDGHYELTLDTPLRPQDGTLDLETDGHALSGTISNARGRSAFAGGCVQGGTLGFTTKVPTPLGMLRATISARVQGDRIEGDATLPPGRAHLTGRRSTGV